MKLLFEKRKTSLLLVAVMLTAAISVCGQNIREKIRLDQGWRFAFGNAADPQKDFGCGTECLVLK